MFFKFLQYAHYKNPNYAKNSQKSREVYPARYFFHCNQSVKKTHRIEIPKPERKK